MHFYLFDAFLANPGYKKELESIENRILDLGIGGRSTYLSVLKSFEDSLENGLSKEITTCVLVGNDATLTKALNILVTHNVTVGLIPIGKDCEMAHYLGLPRGVHGVDLIANRLTEDLDLGKVGQQYFINSVTANTHDLTLKCDEEYELNFKKRLNLNICNLEANELGVANPQDGWLEVWAYGETHSFLFGKKHLKWDSRLYHKKIQINAPKETSLLIDKHKIIKTPAIVEIAKEKIKFIVGRERVFRKG